MIVRSHTLLPISGSPICDGAVWIEAGIIRKVETFADLRGKEVSVDAMSTGFAFVLREMINRSGVKESEVTYVRAGGSPNRFRMLLEGKHAGTLLPTPFEMQLRSLCDDL